MKIFIMGRPAHMQIKYFTSYLILFLIAGLWSCSGSQQTVQPPPMPVAVQQEVVPTISANNEGSLWQARSSMNSLFIDTKARNVGDIVTIKIDENAKATNKADTKTGRSSSLEAGIQKLFGLEDWWQNDILPDVNSKWPKLNPFGNPSVKGNMKSDFDGSGETSRSGNLSAYITCRVTEVRQNGNLRIVGSREVMVNNETQLIILSGTIRPRDISENNVILSTFISDAKIAYSGTGIINERQRPGWLANMLNVVWPF